MIYQLTVVLAALAVASAHVHDRAYYEERFFNWLSNHKVEVPSGQHFVKFLNNFATNDDLIEEHNAEKQSFQLGHNKFSHMGRYEWKAYVSGTMRPRKEGTPSFVHSAPADVSTLATSVDWRTTGAVRSVKDQGQCGSCWSFSATGALEGSFWKKTSNSMDFSPQEFVDCDNLKNKENRGTDMGCGGGWMQNSFTWASKNGGLCEWTEYGDYSASQGTCHDSSCKKAERSPTGYVDVQANSDSAMMSALNDRPVAIAIEADQAAFQLYKSGVFSAACGTNLDHGVLAVGYGTDAASGLDYYIVKNSWGESWGDQGYILLQRGVSQPEGQCGMLSGPPTYPQH